MTNPDLTPRRRLAPTPAERIGQTRGDWIQIELPERAAARWCPIPALPGILALLNCLLWLFASPVALAVDPPRILGAQPANGRLLLTWEGNSYAYEVQRTTNLLQPEWNSVLATARTNGTLTLAGTAAYFRVIDPDTNLTRLELVATNLQTGAIAHLVKQAQTNEDLIFFDAVNATETLGTQRVFPGEELRKFDLALEGTNYWIVTPQGERTALHGAWVQTPGPEPGETTHTGTLTDGTQTLAFLAVAADPALSVGDAAFSAWWCAGAWAAQALQCQAAAAARNLGCVGFFPPKPSAGYGYIESRSGVTLTGTNIVGSCESKCVVCCKDKNTGVLSDCTP